MSIGVMCLCVYVVLILGKFHPVHSKTVLAVSGLLSVIFAYVEAIGLSHYVNLRATAMHQLIPFLVLGVGLDDMFVIVASVREKELVEGADVKKLMRRVMKKAGVSITVTSVTSAVAFALSGLNSIPALSHFAISSCFGIIFCYLNQISFFSAILV